MEERKNESVGGLDVRIKNANNEWPSQRSYLDKTEHCGEA